MDADDGKLIQEQIDYYRRRAPEYDASAIPVHDSLGAHGEMLLEALRRFAPRGKVLELACGTGQYTRRLAEFDCEITALDSSPEMIDLNRRKLRNDAIRYIVADLFSWTPDARYDAVVFTFWLSHVPVARFEEFWRSVAMCLGPEGRVWFADESRHADWRGERFIDEGRNITLRRLRDGSEHRAVKVFWDPEELERRLRALGWGIAVTGSGAFYWGEGHRPN